MGGPAGSACWPPSLPIILASQRMSSAYWNRQHGSTEDPTTAGGQNRPVHQRCLAFRQLFAHPVSLHPAVERRLLGNASTFRLSFKDTQLCACNILTGRVNLTIVGLLMKILEHLPSSRVNIRLAVA